jgi:DNA-directed RNA polymerase specialized sigma24 family protein
MQTASARREPEPDWRRRLDENRRWLRRWLTEQGVEDPEAVLWPESPPEEEQALDRHARRKPLDEQEVALVEDWCVRARGPLWKVLSMRHVPVQEREDIIQETLARVMENPNSFRLRGETGTAVRRWVLGTLRNVVREYARGPGVREIPTEQVAGDDEYLGHAAEGAILTQAGPGFFAALEALTPRHRAAWLAVDLEEADIRRFTDALGENYDNVCTWLKQSRAKLGAAMRPLREGANP